MTAACSQPLLLLLGWRPQLGGAAIRRGLHPVVLFGSNERNWVAPIPEPDCTPVYCDNPTNLEACLGALLRRGFGLGSFHAVCPATEEFVTLGSALARLSGVGGLPLEVAVACRDKALQKLLIHQAGVPHADFTVIPELHGLVYGNEQPSWDTFPAVLKPVAGQGTTLTVRLDSERELLGQSRALAAAEGHRTFMLEEYIDCDEEWEVDGCVQDGELTFLSIGVYTCPLISIHEGTLVQACILDTETDHWCFDLARPMVTAALQALGLRHSVFHMELFFQADGHRLLFGECGARPAGSALPEAVAAKRGFDLYAAHLDLWTGTPVAVSAAGRPDCVGMTQLATRPGVLLEQPTVEEVLALPDVLEVALRYPRGWTMKASTESITHRMGTVVVAGADRSEVTRRLDEVPRWFDRRVRVGPAGDSGPPAWVLRRDQEAEGEH